MDQSKDAFTNVPVPGCGYRQRPGRLSWRISNLGRGCSLETMTDKLLGECIARNDLRGLTLMFPEDY